MAEDDWVDGGGIGMSAREMGFEEPTAKHDGWRCFHCEEHFPATDEGRRNARDHFGDDPFHSEPACIMQLNGGDKYFLRECSKLHAELMRCYEEDSDVVRLFAGKAGKHAEELLRAEEMGYAHGLRDMREEAAKCAEGFDIEGARNIGSVIARKIRDPDACPQANSLQKERSTMTPSGAQRNASGDGKIPVEAAKRVAQEHGLKQCLLIGWDGAMAHVVTYGATPEDCANAAKAQDFWQGAVREFSFRGDADVWKPIVTLPDNDALVLAYVPDGRMMIWKASLLRQALRERTPHHLQFPATHWRELPHAPEQDEQHE